MDVLKKNNLTPAGAKPLDAGTAVPTAPKVPPAEAATPSAPEASPQPPQPCGQARATVHPQDDGTCVIEVTCSCGNVIQVQCITA